MQTYLQKKMVYRHFTRKMENFSHASNQLNTLQRLPPVRLAHVSPENHRGGRPGRETGCVWTARAAPGRGGLEIAPVPAR